MKYLRKLDLTNLDKPYMGEPEPDRNRERDSAATQAHCGVISPT
jgi:hypothetical protein